MIKLKDLLTESIDKSKLKKVYDNLNKGDEVTIKYGSSISKNNERTFVVKKGKTTVGKAKVERITLASKDNPKGVKYYLYNRNGNISFAIGDMGATIDDIQMNESVNETIKNGDVVIFKKSKGEVPKIKYNSYSKEFAADFLSHTDYYKSLKDAIEDMKNAGFVVDKYIQKESVNESKLSFSQLKNGQVLLNKFRSGKKYTIIDVDSKSATLKNLQSGNTMVIYSLNNYELKESVNEANDTYFKAAYEAAEYAREMAEKKGYEIDEDDWQTQIGMGGKHNRLRPGVGKTHSFTVGLTKNGKPQRKALNISLYGMDSGSYELTYYIN